jgi:hypothetical protein
MTTMKWLIGAMLLTSSAVAMASDTTGTYMTFNRSMSESALPGGGHTRLVHYYQAGTSDKADSPFAGRTSECVGRMIVSSAGKITDGSGFCFAQDAAGNGGSWTWKVTEAGTEKCPSVCGTFKWAEGYGNAKKVTASGAWKQTYVSKDGGIGTYALTYAP